MKNFGKVVKRDFCVNFECASNNPFGNAVVKPKIIYRENGLVTCLVCEYTVRVKNEPVVEMLRSCLEDYVGGQNV